MLPPFNQLEGEFSIIYTTDTVILEVIPSINLVSTTPTNNAINIPINTTLNIQFNGDINPTILTDDSVAIYGANSGITDISPSTVNNKIADPAIAILSKSTALSISIVSAASLDV